MRVLIPSPLRSYTAGASAVAADGATLANLMHDLDRRFPGLRFRIIDEQGAIRRHIKCFVNAESAASLALSLRDTDEVMIVCALSGG
ncbi:MAG: MoaD/ThiS family protein [Casimicrobiaceae bacterium]